MAGWSEGQLHRQVRCAAKSDPGRTKVIPLIPAPSRPSWLPLLEIRREHWSPASCNGLAEVVSMRGLGGPSIDSSTTSLALPPHLLRRILGGCAESHHHKVLLYVIPHRYHGFEARLPIMCWACASSTVHCTQLAQDWSTVHDIGPLRVSLIGRVS